MKYTTNNSISVLLFVMYGVRKNLPLSFNGMERVPFPFNNILLTVYDPFLVRSRSMRILRPF